MRSTAYFKLGLFILFTLALFTALILMLGMFDSFQPKAHLITVVAESVQGLTPGSAVKYQGVPIGKVSDITIDMSRAGELSRLIRIDMEIDLKKFRMEKVGQLDRNEFYSIIRADQTKGLRCNLSPDGITGMMYIDLEFVQNPAPDPLAENPILEPDALYVPSVPSLLKDLRTSMMAILDKLGAIDFAKIGRQVEATLGSAQKRLDDPRLTNTFIHIEKAAVDLEATAKRLNEKITPEVLDQVMTDLKKTLTAVDELSIFVRQEIKDADFGKTTAEFRQTMKNLDESVSALTHTLNETLDSATEFLQYLDSDPASLIRGKGRPENPETERKHGRK